MTPKEFAKQMKEITDKYTHDPETCHSFADDLLCEALTALGYKKGIEIYKDMIKWYA